MTTHDTASGRPHRAGYVAICGRPNVGKSTLVNALLGQTIAVATRLPQTTREKMLGIWSEPRFQAILIDTPGIHRARSALNRFMVGEALRAADDVDLILMLAEAPLVENAAAATAWEPGPVALEVLQSLQSSSAPLALVLTKIDRLRGPSLLLPVVETWSGLHEFAAIVPVSAKTGDGIEVLGAEVCAHLPEGEALYDPDQVSDRTMRWHAAELVRAELFERLGQELPYSCAVTIDEFREHSDRDTVRATVHVERDGQKRIVIGRGGRTIKAVSMAARKRVAELTGRPCDLFLDVRVSKNWTRDPRLLEQLGYADDNGGP